MSLRSPERGSSLVLEVPTGLPNLTSRHLSAGAQDFIRQGGTGNGLDCVPLAPPVQYSVVTTHRMSHWHLGESFCTKGTKASDDPQL